MYKETAKRFAAALQDLAENPDNLDNLISYLSLNFGFWMERYARTPDELVRELEQFAKKLLKSLLT